MVITFKNICDSIAIFLCKKLGQGVFTPQPKLYSRNNKREVRAIAFTSFAFSEHKMKIILANLKKL